MRRLFVLFATLVLAVTAVCATPVSESTSSASSVIVTDMIGRQVEVVPGSYTRVVCIGAGALRMYSYINGADLLCGVEDIDNTSLQNRPKMFDSVAIPYRIAFETEFSALPSCGVGGPQAQAAEAEKILSCNPDIVISEYEDVDKENALQEQLGVPVITLRSGPNNVFDDSFKGSLRLLGQLFGKEERAENLISFIDSERAAISARTTSVAEDQKPSVYICGLGNWGTTNHLMTAQEYLPFRIANIRNAVSGLPKNGIQPIDDDPNALAFKRFRLAPQPGSRLESASAVFFSPYGMISSSWLRDTKKNTLSWNFAVPDNTTAEITLPAPEVIAFSGSSELQHAPNGTLLALPGEYEVIMKC